MRLMKSALATLAVTGILAGGGAALASAASTGSTTTTTTTPATKVPDTAQGTSTGSAAAPTTPGHMPGNCPNM
jgi:hypothetical protein